MSGIDSLFQLVLNNIPARVFWKDIHSNYLGGNSLFVGDAGVGDVKSLIGKSDYNLAWTKEQADAFRQDDRAVIANGVAKINFEEPQDHPDGKQHWLQTSKIPLRDDNGAIIGVLGIYRDITREKEHQIEMEKQARHDNLTGLPNRNYLQECLSGESAGKAYAWLLFVDLDYFKTVNDSLGHSVGDMLLKKVAVRLSKVVGDAGFVARLGGDEFSVLMHKRDGKDQDRVSTMIAENILQSFEAPFYVEKHILYLGASIGIAEMDTTGVDVSQKFREADLAMYEAKSRGRNAFAFYNAEMRKKIESDHDLLTRLRQAIDTNSFHLVYQPQYDSNRSIVGVEALIRWVDPEVGLVSPAEFIPNSEKTGLIHPIGEWLFSEARSAIKRWVEKKKFSGRISINISALQFMQENFVNLLQRKLVQSELSPEYFELEITESLLLGNEELALGKLKELRDLGFTIAIDDFGTGYSSLSYLSRLPVDKLKIDRSFISRMFVDKKDEQIVKLILQMANSLGIKTVAEGVETEKEFKFLIENNCSIYQGFYLARPIAEQDFVALL